MYDSIIDVDIEDQNMCCTRTSYGHQLKEHTKLTSKVGIILTARLLLGYLNVGKVEDKMYHTPCCYDVMM